MLHKKWIRALTINLHRDYSNSLTSVKVGELFLELKLLRTLFKLRKRKPSLAYVLYKRSTNIEKGVVN